MLNLVALAAASACRGHMLDHMSGWSHMCQPSCSTTMLAQMSRRAVLLGAASAFSAVSEPASAKLSPDELKGVRERAKDSTLTTDRVIRRALRAELVSPKRIDDCDSLTRLSMIDHAAVSELTPAMTTLEKLADLDVKTSFRTSLKRTEAVVSSIRDQITAIDAEKAARNCDAIL